MNSSSGGYEDIKHATSTASPTQPAQQPTQPGTSASSDAAFREKLKHPSAQPLLQSLRDFIDSFAPAGLTRVEAAKSVSQYLSKAERVMFDCVVFSADADEQGRALQAEGLEAFLLKKLHPNLFSMDPIDVRQDAQLRKRIGSLGWVGFGHLGLMAAVEAPLLELAIKQLSLMDAYKAPRDKLVCVQNACNVINNVLKLTITEQNAPGKRPFSADDFLPLLIFAVVRANPRHLHSNLEFIAHFRHPSRLRGEPAYFLTNLQSAVAFIQNATPKDLDVTTAEFDERSSAALADFEQRQGGENSASAASGGGGLKEEQQSEGLTGSNATSSAAAAATLDVKAAVLPGNALRTLHRRVRKPALSGDFASCAARDLRVAEIPRLVDEYRMLVKQWRDLEEAYEQLAASFLEEFERSESLASTCNGEAHRQLCEPLQRVTLRYEHFCGSEAASELRLGEIPAVLQEYRKLVRLFQEVEDAKPAVNGVGVSRSGLRGEE
eukprot:TRINITY_DN44005_c0_g1_i1.p1 TRINITY_DN44005_c0_g1~~TRINITY_DN44005_c0_g1_i1.p1  ORF type:complete len:493 (-),score=108.14 TRINITY_DN44005_c0_g1_i1:185-1663(-)